MNVEFKNIKDNEWITTNEEGKIRFVKTDAQTEELGDILSKEDKLELLQKNKNDILEGIERTNGSMKFGKSLNRATLISLIIIIGLSLIINQGFSPLITLPLIMGGLFAAGLETIILYVYKQNKKLMAIYEEELQEINEKEPELEKEIEKLKEKHNFKEEAKEAIYLNNLRYENTEEKRLIRTRTK